METKMSPLKELVYLLTGGLLEEDELTERVNAIEHAQEDPDLAWVSSPEQATEVALYGQLSEFIAESDKIDELHEQIADFFEPPLPDFPYQTHQKMLPAEYYQWLDGHLAEREKADGGYGLLVLDIGIDDNVRALVVLRRDIDRVLELAEQLSIIISLPN
jgi:hypothetical protein